MPKDSVYQDVSEIIGNTPLVRLRSLEQIVKGKVYAKLEGLNPGLSTKDRIVLHMLEVAEKEGKIKPGGTVIEATSGNTGFSLAMISATKGYKCILTMKDKISKTKVEMIEAMGGTVIICPSNVKPDDPKSYFSVAKKLNKQIPNSHYLNQNFNIGNMEAHYLGTGKEIWEQTEGKLTYFLACASTGGTISGTAKYIKERNPNVRVVAVDSEGSLLSPYFKTGEIDNSVSGSTQLEGVGKKIIPGNIEFSLIDRFITVEDKASAHAAYQLARTEGLLMGYSSGAAIEGLKQLNDELTDDDITVILLSDHGAKYLTKIYNKQWMKDQGFWTEELEPEPLEAAYL
ncbi:MAG: pyridoxal-phosphate dependent enzyme [Chitinophagales bacterium]